MVVAERDTLTMRKAVGTLNDFEKSAVPSELKGTRGIGHTRWATHGGVSEKNAHPHLSCDGRIAVVHNGIIENYLSIRSALSRKGHLFSSGTDSEVIVHLIEDELKGKATLKDAVLSAISMLRGSYGLLITEAGTNTLIAVKNESPLILGIDQNKLFAASDPVPILKYTSRVVYLNDGELAILSPKRFECFTFDGQGIGKTVSQIDWKAESSEKGDYEHFMLKEIEEQPQAIKHASMQDEEDVVAFANEIKNAKGVILVANGTALHAGLAGQYLFDRIARKHVNVVNASEFPYLQTSLSDGSLVIAISQSGETADVLNALKLARAKGARIFSIVNVVGSSIERMSERVLYLRVGPEIAVASTKAFMGQLAILYLLAQTLNGEVRKGLQDLRTLSHWIRETIETNHERVKVLAKVLSERQDVYFIGRAINYPLALEGALKMKEISYIHAEGMPAGELKHGTLALVEKRTPILLLNAGKESREASIGNAMETKARGAWVIGVSEEHHESYDEWLELPKASNRVSPLLAVIPLQLLAYYCAVYRGINPDRPRNLAKSVTVK